MKAWRILLGLALVAAWLATLRHAGARVGTAATIAASALFLVAAVAFVLRRLELAAAIVLSVLLGVGAALDPARAGEHHARLLPGAAVVGYALALLACRWRAHRGDPLAAERAGLEAVWGIAGAAYALSAVAKLVGTGLSWGRGDGLALLIAERSLLADGWLANLRAAVAARPALCTALAVGTLAIELGGAAALVPRVRRAWVLLALALHGGVALLMGYVYVPWMLLLLALALAPRERR